METLKEKTVELVKNLPKDKLKEAYNYLVYMNDKAEWEATMELNHPEILKEIKEGINELKNGDFVKFKSVRRDV